MKNRQLEFKTKFWRDAAARLPVRYHADLKRAERVELALGRLVDAFRRVKNALGRRPFHTPRGAH